MKKTFKWEAGEELKPEDYEAVKEIRQVGFTKLADGLYVDPEARKEQRKKKLLKPIKVKKGDFTMEESHSGLTKNVDPGKAAELLKKDVKKFKGADIFSGEASLKTKVKSDE